MTILVQDDKLECYGALRKKIGEDHNCLALHLGPQLPPRAEGSLFKTVFKIFVFFIDLGYLLRVGLKLLEPFFNDCGV